MATIARPRPARRHDDVVARTSTVSLLARARALRDTAPSVHPVLAQAYRRRAAELDLQAWAQANQTTHTEVDDLLPAA